MTSKKSIIKHRNLLIGGGALAALSLIAIASMFGYSLRTAVYVHTQSAMMSPNPSSSPLSTCPSLTAAQLADLQQRIQTLGTEIADLSQQITTADRARIPLIASVQMVEVQLRGATTQATIAGLTTRQDTLLAQIDRINIQIQSLEMQINELDMQQNQLQQIVAQHLRCNP